MKNWRFKRAIVRYAESSIRNIYSVNDYKQIAKRLKVGISLNPTQHFAPILWMNLKDLKASFVDSNPANLETRLPNK